MRQLVFFGTVGATASLVHFLFAALLFSARSLNLFAANLLGFMVAVCISYLGHYYLTFRSSRPHSAALFPFLLTALFGFAITNIVLAVATWILGSQSQWSLLIAIIIAAACVYVLSKRWVFSHR